MRKESHCDACVCSYCRWRGTDNCLRCEDGSCLKCGERIKQKRPIYDCNGYCCMVERSKTQREKVRRPDMERCELYKPGDFSTRYRTEVNE